MELGVVGGTKTANRTTTAIAGISDQCVRIGEGAMAGKNSAFTKPIVPLNTVAGPSARVIGVNDRGMERWGRGPEPSGE
jgi:acyl-[acyl carrier protein]--UDP-N-acetylglucosamine O-acyltransferase